MFREKTKEFVKEAVNEEIQNAMQYPLYRNENEYLGVMYEEYDELIEEFEALNTSMEWFRKSIRKKDKLEILHYTDLIRNRAMSITLEALQIMAVAEKGQRSFDGENKNEEM